MTRTKTDEIIASLRGGGAEAADAMKGAIVAIETLARCLTDIVDAVEDCDAIPADDRFTIMLAADDAKQAGLI